MSMFSILKNIVWPDPPPPPPPLGTIPELKDAARRNAGIIEWQHREASKLAEAVDSVLRGAVNGANGR